jgi:hypothetical protein
MDSTRAGGAKGRHNRLNRGSEDGLRAVTGLSRARVVFSQGRDVFAQSSHDPAHGHSAATETLLGRAQSRNVCTRDRHGRAGHATGCARRCAVLARHRHVRQHGQHVVHWIRHALSWHQIGPAHDVRMAARTFIGLVVAPFVALTRLLSVHADHARRALRPSRVGADLSRCALRPSRVDADLSRCALRLSRVGADLSRRALRPSRVAVSPCRCVERAHRARAPPFRAVHQC